MVALFVDGRKRGEWSGEDGISLEALRVGKVEFRDATGAVVAMTVAAAEPLCPWDPTLTIEQIDREVAAGGGVPLAEIWRELGVR